MQNFLNNFGNNKNPDVPHADTESDGQPLGSGGSPPPIQVVLRAARRPCRFQVITNAINNINHNGNFSPGLGWGYDNEEGQY